MKKSNNKSTQTDGSSGVKMSVEDKNETKMKIAELKETHLSLCQRRIGLENVPCAIDMEICRIEQAIDKEYAKIGISMTDLPEKQKEAWK